MCGCLDFYNSFGGFFYFRSCLEVFYSRSYYFFVWRYLERQIFVIKVLRKIGL